MVTLIFNTVDQTKPIPIPKTKVTKTKIFPKPKPKIFYLRCVTSSVVTATARTNLIRKPSNRNKKTNFDVNRLG